MTVIRDQRDISSRQIANEIIIDYAKSHDENNPFTTEEALYSILLTLLIVTNPDITGKEVYESLYVDCVTEQTKLLDYWAYMMLKQLRTTK